MANAARTRRLDRTEWWQLALILNQKGIESLDCIEYSGQVMYQSAGIRTQPSITGGERYSNLIVFEQCRSNGDLDSNTFVSFYIPQRVHSTQYTAMRWTDAGNRKSIFIQFFLSYYKNIPTLKLGSLTQPPWLRTPCATKLQPRTIHDPEYPSPKQPPLITQ